MGFFGGLCNMVVSGMRWLGEKLGLISEKVGSSNSVTENSSLTSIEEMNELLMSYAKEYKRHAERCESECVEMTDQYFADLLGKIKKNKELQDKIGLRNLENAHHSLHKEIHRSMLGVVEKRLSLDDRECKKIIALPASDSKKFKITNFCKKVMQEANDNLSNKVEGVLKRQSEELNQFLQCCTEEKEQSLRNRKQEFENLEKNLMNEDFAAEQLQIIPRQKLYLIKYIEENLGVQYGQTS